MAEQSMLRLNDGAQIPQLGFGVFLAKDGDEAYGAVRAALDAGYRHIDTAAVYGNEASVGRAIRDSGVDRDEIFVTTKVWNDDVRARRAKEALGESLRRLGLDHVDLCLIHWPADGWEEAWKALAAAKKDGLSASIGVSNFQIPHLARLAEISDAVPAVNQVECHPRLPQHELLRWCRDHGGIALEAWSPLGGSRSGESLRTNPVLEEIASEHGRSTAQILIRWQIERGVIVLPKSVHKERIVQNLDVFGFSLTKEDRDRICTLDDGFRYGSSPDTFDF
jgi:diketogulonate reductase-like aldo/keto reductase